MHERLGGLNRYFFAALLAIALAGCARTKVVEISAVPPDSNIRIDGKDRGRGPITETFIFAGDTASHTVQAEREGYRQNKVMISPEFDQQRVTINLKPVPRRVTFSVTPMPGLVKVDGVPVSNQQVSEYTKDIEFPIDPATGKWVTHTVTAEHEGFEPVSVPLNYEDRDSIYHLNLGAKRKNVAFTTNPPGAKVYLNDRLLGETPILPTSIEFPVDLDTDTFAPQKLRIEKVGFQAENLPISWDDGKLSYEFALKPQQKTVRIFTDPPDATVMIGNAETKLDPASGAHVATLAFGPMNGQDEFRTHDGIASKKKTTDGEWEPTPFRIHWDNGTTDYRIKVKEILIRKVPMLRLKLTRADNGWTIGGEELMTIALKDESEGQGPKPVKITRLVKGTKIDSLAVSPDGSQIVFTTLSNGSGELRSQILAQPAEGSTDTQTLSDGRSLEIMPSYTPDGTRIICASNRAGRKLSIWSMSVMEHPEAPEQLTLGLETCDLWPSVDSNPKPRLFYESRIDSKPDPRIFSKPIEGRVQDLTSLPTGGMQPRVSPAADAVLFCAEDEKTHKRDIYRMSDQGRDVVNLTKTPDVDEYDATWSSDGVQIAFASDQGQSADAPTNRDLWIMNAAGGEVPTRITSNPGWDDSPAWDPRGKALYFRSNRGGEWNVWRIELK